MGQTRIRDIHAGKPDAKEDISRNKREFMNSYLIPPNLDVESLMAGDICYIVGNKGLGKTAALRYLNQCLLEKNHAAVSTFLLFERDYTHQVKPGMESVASQSFVTYGFEGDGEPDEEADQLDFLKAPERKYRLKIKTMGSLIGEILPAWRCRMKNKLWKKFFLIIFSFLCLLFAGSACAEDADPEHASSNVIVEFESVGSTAPIETGFKLAMVTLQKHFPEQLSVRLEGQTIFQLIPVNWKCMEDYEMTSDIYHFEPLFEGYTLSEGTEPPILSVHVLGESVTPPLTAAQDVHKSEVPIIGRRFRDSTAGLESYSSFDAGRLPVVRSQAPYGSCWAFGSIGAMEADLIADGAGTDIDLSELHLAYYACHGFYDEKNCSMGDAYDYTKNDWLDLGGDPKLAARVLSNLVGAAAEASVPYTWGSSYTPGPFEGRAYKDAQLLNCYELNPGDTAGIKEAIVQHGGVATSIYWDDACYSYTSNSLYCPERSLTNHTIMLVGWDDTFSRYNFRAGTPDRDGAWLVRNSWGLDDYGREGYLWLSYADPSILRDSVYVFDARSGQYDHCYSYTEIPNSIDLYEYNDSVTAVQHFKVDGGEQISAVGFEVLSSGLNVRIGVSSGGKTVETSAAVIYPGYYTAALPESVVIARRSDVTITIIYEGAYIKIPTECAEDCSYPPRISSGFCDSGGLVLNGINTGEDGFIKLFTMDCDTAGEGVRISSENFPDNVFRNYISSSFDTDHDGYLSDEEIAAVTVIDFVPAGTADKDGQEDAGIVGSPGPVKSLKGLEFFSELQVLSCAGSQLTTIDVSLNTNLQQLNCSSNSLTSLDLSRNNALRMLSCDGNPLTELDISQCPELTGLISTSLPDLSEFTVVFSADGCLLVYDIGIDLIPSFHLGTGLPIDETAFPDLSFRSYVADRCDMDRDGTLTDHELSAVKYIDCSGNAGSCGDIVSLKGIELFPSLEELYCGYNRLTALDVSGNPVLKTLYCRNNLLGQLTIHGNTALQVLDCRENQDLADLNLSGCAELLILECSGAQLLSLDLSGCRLLEELSCGSNQGLTLLDIGSCTALRTLSCSNVQIPGLDLRGCTDLQKLECSNNPVLNDLNISNCAALTELACSGCPMLEDLDISGCTELDSLECFNDHLSNLDLTNCEWLSNLTCYGNQITVLDVVPSFILSAIMESYPPVVENGIVSYPYEGHKIAFDEGVILIYTEPDLILPDSLKTIDEEAFAGCAFRYVVLSGQTGSIGIRAFADCPFLDFIRIPNKDIYIDEQAFGDKTDLVIFGISGGTAETFAQSHGFTFVSD